jgi:hypothetical protein
MDAFGMTTAADVGAPLVVALVETRARAILAGFDAPGMFPATIHTVRTSEEPAFSIIVLVPYFGPAELIERSRSELLQLGFTPEYAESDALLVWRWLSPDVLQ